MAAIATTGFVNAYVNTYNEGETDRRMTWTSTCDINHWTDFPDYWSAQQIAQWVSDQNTRECGVRPRNVYVNLDPSMLKITVEK